MPANPILSGQTLRLKDADDDTPLEGFTIGFLSTSPAVYATTDVNGDVDVSLTSGIQYTAWIVPPGTEYDQVQITGFASIAGFQPSLIKLRKKPAIFKLLFKDFTSKSGIAALTITIAQGIVANASLTDTTGLASYNLTDLGIDPTVTIEVSIGTNELGYAADTFEIVPSSLNNPVVTLLKKQ